MTAVAARRGLESARVQAAVRLIGRHSSSVMATARRHAASPDDAEDAYQRGIEILLTKAPLRDGRPVPDAELVSWLRTVVKHEAWAIRRQRLRVAPVVDDGDPPELPSPPAVTHDAVEQLDRMRVAAEAMRRLKPQEARALQLKAEGYSYKEIQAICGWTYTKVNRCLTEGRKAFVEQVAAIEAGERCENLRRAAEGSGATADASGELRAHVRHCLPCREWLRETRSALAA